MVKIEIWSDIMCPFCYMGKKQLEKAIEQVSYKEEIEIVWKSFELNPDIKFIPGKKVNEYLSETKGMSIDDVQRMQDRITEQGHQLGIEFKFENTPISNSHNAHKLIHVAQKQNKANQIKEELFYQYFTLGKNIEDTNVLLEIAGIHKVDLTEYQNDLFSDSKIEAEVIQDIYQAQQVGARGVPFFVFDNYYALSGAHGSETMYKILETVRIKNQKNV